ncbi:MAG: single-stranded-DNA-specific exonuclease RecJ [Anaerolineae bacterium]|nr:single-stranded-DNA-specific exonuclease RecJ [Anaerolineae bacterium]
MLRKPKRWEIAPPAPDEYLNRFPDLHPLAAQALYNRKIIADDDVAAFLAASTRVDDPFQLSGMHPAVTRLRQAIRDGEQIAVYGDFDVDGVTATALLVLALRALGGVVRPYIPHRVEEGYGLNVDALKELAREGVQVVVTVDCGIRFPNEIAYARQQGMDVIVTDHHAVGKDALAAVAVINPHQAHCSYPYPHLAGVGIAYKLAQALLRVNSQVPIRQPARMEEGDLLDLVALGTVADMVPLTGENRTLVIQGLERINREPRPGIEALMRQANLDPGHVDAEAIGYGLGPRLNAAGRVAHAETAYQLLTAEYPAEAERLAQQLDDLNRERQRITSQVQERAREIASAQRADQPLIFIADPDFPAGIVGLVASRLMEEFYRPAVIVEMGEHQSRGSARSIPEFHITQALDQCADLLIQHGGHAAAAGFAVRTADLPQLKSRLVSLAEAELSSQGLVPILRADAEVLLRDMSWEVWEALQKLRPFGEENPEPLLVSRDVQVRRQRAVGSEGSHLKLFLSDGSSGWDGIAFHQGDWADHLPDRINVAYHLQLNEWNGQRRLQLNIQDIQPSGQETA